jgi:hypothetical protein
MSIKGEGNCVKICGSMVRLRLNKRVDLLKASC